MALIIPPHGSSTSVDSQLGPGNATKTTGRAVTPVDIQGTAPAHAPQGENLVISDAMRVQIRSLASAERTANDGIALAQTADEALDRLGGLLEQMRELAKGGAVNARESAGDASTVEYSRLQTRAAEIQKDVTYDGRPLLGTEPVEVAFDVPTEGGATDRFALTLGGLAPLTALAPDAAPGVGSPAAVVGRIDDVLAAITDKRARFAAAVNRFAGATAAVQTARASRIGGAPPLENAASAEQLATLARTQILGRGPAAALLQSSQLSAQAVSLLQD